MKIGYDILKMNKILNELGYTGIGGRESKRKVFSTKTLPKLIEETHNSTFEEITDNSDDLQGERLKIVIPSNIMDIYTRLEILLGLKLSGQSDTLIES